MAKWGETILGNSFKLGPGGKGSNQAVAAARLNADVRLITKIGRDAFGEMAKQFYQQEGMSVARIYEDPEATSATATIVIDEKTQENAIIVVQGACGCLTVEEVEAAAVEISSSDVFLTQLESHSADDPWYRDCAPGWSSGHFESSAGSPGSGRGASESRLPHTQRIGGVDADR